jgi:hypothetical protein
VRVPRVLQGDPQTFNPLLGNRASSLRPVASTGGVLATMARQHRSLEAIQRNIAAFGILSLFAKETGES